MNQAALEQAIDQGHIDSVRTIWDRMSDQERTHLLNKTDDIFWTGKFARACQEGHLEVVQWYHDIFPALAENQISRLLMCQVCRAGQLEIAKYLLTITPNLPFDVRTGNYFVEACAGGHRAVAKFIAQTYPETKTARVMFEALIDALRWSQLATADWLWPVCLQLLTNPHHGVSEKKIANFYRDLSTAFYEKIAHNNLAIVKWIVRVHPQLPTLKAFLLDFDNLPLRAARKGHQDMVEFLLDFTTWPPAVLAQMAVKARERNHPSIVALLSAS